MAPCIIRISSQKGGVGKTTFAVNLALALQSAGHDVLLIDADSTNPSIGFHLGMTKSASGFKNVAQSKASFNEVISVHAPSGVHVVNGVIGAKPFVVTKEEAYRMISSMRKMPYDFIIVDTQPGYYNMGIVTYFDEVIIITTPDMPSCVSAMRMSLDYDKAGVKNFIVVNRVRDRGYEIHPGEIKRMFPGKAAGFIPEDEIVPISIAEHIPALLLNKRSKFSKSVIQMIPSIAPQPKMHATRRRGVLRFIRELLVR